MAQSHNSLSEKSKLILLNVTRLTARLRWFSREYLFFLLAIFPNLSRLTVYTGLIASGFAVSWKLLGRQQWILKHDKKTFLKNCRGQLLFTKEYWQLKLFAQALATFYE